MSPQPRYAILDAEYAEMVALVAGHSGMVFAPNRRAEAQTGMVRAMRNAGVSDLPSYLRLVRSGGLALDLLVDELTVGETHFMRDQMQMQLIRSELLPPLRQSGRPPRVWSAGCATGEEAYSLAILLEEAGLHEEALVLGTDLSAAALAKARTASYSDWSMRGVDADFLQLNFRHAKGRRIVAERLRRRVRFERLNLVGSEPYASVGATRMDLILCRNVLIYFPAATAGQIAARLYDSLAEGGVLLTAGADLLLSSYAPFEVEVTRVGLVYRRPLASDRRRTPRVSWAAVPPRRPRSLGLPPTGGAPLLWPPIAPPPVPLPLEVLTGPALAATAAILYERTLAEANAEGPEAAQRGLHEALRLFPLDAPLHCLCASLLIALDRDDEAEQEARRAVYLDRTLVMAQFLLGTILRKRGAHQDALRTFRTVRRLCSLRPASEPVPAGGGELTSALDAAATTEIVLLEVSGG